MKNVYRQNWEPFSLQWLAEPRKDALFFYKLFWFPASILLIVGKWQFVCIREITNGIIHISLIQQNTETEMTFSFGTKHSTDFIFLDISLLFSFDWWAVQSEVTFSMIIQQVEIVFICWRSNLILTLFFMIYDFWDKLNLRILCIIVVVVLWTDC